MGQLLICGAWVAAGVYVVPMSKGVEVVSVPALSNDLRQAEYFWRLLDSRKAEVCELLEAELDALEGVQRTGCLVGVRHHRQRVKAFEAEIRGVDRMLLALRVRFGMPTLRRTM